ncbi:MAG: glycosyltransferase family 39 protein [Ignavibacteria bacterium]|nr:glycosyltransferase family 39 protein [Ignavibacteria bacterium]
MKKTTPKINKFFENRKALILTVVSSALLVRAIFLYLFSRTYLWMAIWSDSATYNQWARRIVVNHDWLGQDPFFMTPLYPYFLAITYSIFGFDLLAVRLVQLAIGVGAVVCVFFIGEQLFSRRVGFVAALIASVYGPFILYNNLLLVETLKVFFLVLTVSLLLFARERQQVRWWITSGASLGFAILCRPTDFMVMAVVGAWVFSFLQWSAQQKLVRFGGFVLGVIMLIVPVTVRNYAVSGEFVFITSNGGLNFYLGNNPQAVGVYYNVDRLDLANDPDGRVYAETLLNRTLSPSEVSAYWLSKSLDFVLGQPVDFLQLLGRKALLFFHHKEISQLGYNYQFINTTSIPLLSYLPSFLIVGPLGILGCILARKHWKELTLLYGVLFAEVIAVIAFFVTDRFRLSAMPFMILFAGYALVELYRQWQKKQVRNIVAAATILVAAILFTTALNYDIPDEFSTEYEYLGMLYFDAKQYDNAMRAYTEALRYRNSFHIHNNIGNVYLARGNIKSALAEYDIGYSLNPRQAISHFSRGTAFVSIQDWESALKACERAIEINPRFAPAYLNKGLTLYYMQRFPEALEYMERYTELERDRSKLATVYKDIENLRTIIQRQSR